MSFFSDVKEFYNDAEDIARTGIDSFNDGKNRVGSFLDGLGSTIRRVGAGFQKTGRVVQDDNTYLALGALSDDFGIPSDGVPYRAGDGPDWFGVAALGLGGVMLYAMLTEGK